MINDNGSQILSLMQKEYKDYLPTVQQYTIQHIRPNSDAERFEVNRQIRNEFKDAVGVYIYLHEQVVLYVGIGKLAERVRFHYYESFGKYSGRGCEKHIRFFTQFPGEITILWLPIVDRNEQLKLEKEWTHLLNPKYEEMKRNGLLKPINTG